jgi:hypothetical protein
MTLASSWDYGSSATCIPPISPLHPNYHSSISIRVTLQRLSLVPVVAGTHVTARVSTRSTSSSAVPRVRLTPVATESAYTAH